ncbi:MAG: ATP-grasp domain-containing protein [Zavarzinella sp.]
MIHGDIVRKHKWWENRRDSNLFWNRVPETLYFILQARCSRSGFLMEKKYKTKCALVQVEIPNRPIIEASALLEVLPKREISVGTFSKKQLYRGHITLNPTTLIAGNMDVVPWALKRLNCDGPFLTSYPTGLAEFYGRQLSVSTLEEVRRRVEYDGRPLFVKPLHPFKRFNGFVYESRTDDANFHGASYRMPVYVSQVVHFVSEFRVYIAHTSIVGITPYAGHSVFPPTNWLKQILNALQESKELSAGCSIDVGLMNDGTWVVVECNDGFALGQYPGLSSDSYADVIIARWEELMKMADRTNNQLPT